MTKPVKHQPKIGASSASPPIDAGPRSSASIHGYSRDRSIAVLLDPKVAGPMLWDLVDKTKQGVNPLTELIQALSHLDQPIFGFAKTSGSGHYQQIDPYGFCGYVAFEQLSRKSKTVYHPTCLNLAGFTVRIIVTKLVLHLDQFYVYACYGMFHISSKHTSRAQRNTEGCKHS